MNRRGGIYLSVVIGVFIFMIGMLFINFLPSQVEQAQGIGNTSISLNCGTKDAPNLNISDGGKLTCLLTETVNPYFIWLILSIVGAVIAGRFIRSTR